MKAKLTFVVCALILGGTSGAKAQSKTIAVVPGTSRIQFNIGHLLSSVDGQFRKFHGEIRYDARAPTHCSVRWEVQVDSVDTENAERDHHLGTKDYFNAEKFPTMTFASDSITSPSANHLNVVGKFTLKGVTKEIAVPVEISEHGFEADFVIARSAYGFTAGAPVVGDRVKIHLHVDTHDLWFPH